MLFSELPKEMRLEILSHLKIQHLASAMLVSKQFKDESNYIIQQKSIAELNENLSELISYLNDKIGDLKKELKEANANKNMFIKNSLPISATVVTVGQLASFAIPIIDFYLFYKMTQSRANVVDLLGDTLINMGVGLLEIPAIFITKKAKKALAEYDETRKEAFDKVTKCEKALTKKRIDTACQLRMARQRIAEKNKFFKSKPIETEDNLKSFDIDLEKQAEKSSVVTP